MSIDHIAATKVFIEDPSIIYNMRLIGRLSFPIFAFLIAEGYFYTKNIKSYLIRLGTFAIISEMFFDLAFNNSVLEFESQNIFFTLFLGLVAISLFDRFKNKNYHLSLLILIGMGILSILLKTDYNVYGIILIFIFYLFRNQFIQTLFAIIVLNVIYSLAGYDQIYSNQSASIVALVFIYFYNHKKGRNYRYLFYIFYPLHLLLLYIIKQYIS